MRVPGIRKPRENIRSGIDICRSSMRKAAGHAGSHDMPYEQTIYRIWKNILVPVSNQPF